MARNGSGTFNRLYDWTDDAAAGTKISSTRMDAEMDGMATALTDSLAKDGQTTPTANLPMGTFRHTGVGEASARTDYARASQDQDSSLKYASAGGTADVITLTLAPAITAYAAGQRFHFIASGTNTGAVTLNVSGVGVTAVKKRGGDALVAGDIISGQAVCVVHDGTDFELENPGDYVTIATTQTVSGVKTFSGANTHSGNNTYSGTSTFQKQAGMARSALTDAATIAVDASLSNVFTVTLGGNRTLGQPTNPQDGQAITIFITQDGTGSRTLAYHADWLFPGGVDPTLSTTAAAVDVLSAIYNGATTKWYAVLNKAFA